MSRLRLLTIAGRCPSVVVKYRVCCSIGSPNLCLRLLMRDDEILICLEKFGILGNRLSRSGVRWYQRVRCNEWWDLEGAASGESVAERRTSKSWRMMEVCAAAVLLSLLGMGVEDKGKLQSCFAWVNYWMIQYSVCNGGSLVIFPTYMDRTVKTVTP